ncbi:thioesterase domain-containing protein, partial [Streptomyces sp. SID5910]|uniref:thioesterase domain-containing protein n=1 Tax=Streptomyces sp. SID5910 TaxID=2690312 RepID=UPI0013A8BFD6
SFDTLLRALLDTPTVAGLARSLRSGAEAAPATEAAPAARTSALIPLAGSGAGPVRLLVYDGSGTLTPYDALITELGTDAPLFGIAVPDGDPCPDLAAPDLVEELAGGYAREVRAAGFDAVEIIGHGLGGPVALELARALSEADVTVRRLTLVSGHRMPSPPAVLARIRDAVAQYDPLPYAGDITFLRPVEPVPGAPGPTDDTSAFWRGTCLGDVTVVDVPGDHFSCLRRPHVTRLADALTARPAERR